MPFDGSGNFSRDYNWQQDRDNDIRILAERMDGEFDNYAGGLNQTFLRTGIVPMQGTLNMNNNSIIGITAGTAASPGIKFNGDPNSGFYLASLNSLGFSTNGLNRLTIGNTGVTIAQGLTVGGNLAVTGTTSFTGNITGTPTFNPGLNIVDAAFTLGIVSANPRITFDTGDNITYDRTNDRMSFVAGASMRLRVSPTETWSLVGLQVVDANFNLDTPSGNPRITLDTGSDYVQFTRASNTLSTVINASTRLSVSDAAISALVPVLVRDSNYLLDIISGVPLIQFDANDYISYDRTANQYLHRIGGTTIVATTGTGVAITGTLGTTGAVSTGGTLSVVDASYTLGVGANPFLQMDATDYIDYNRASNVWQHRIGSTIYQSLSATAFSVTPNATFGNNVVVSGDTLSVGDATFAMSNAGTGTPGLTVDTGDIIRFQRATNLFEFVTGSTLRAGVGSGGYYVPTSSGIMFDGQATTAASNCYIAINSGVPTFVTDTNDSFRYDRTNNRHEFVIGSVVAAAVSATEVYNGTATSGNELGYEDLKQVIQAGAYTLALGDRAGHVLYTGAGGHTYTVPANATTAFPIGSAITIINDGAGSLTIARAASVAMHYVYGSPTDANRTLASKGVCTLIKTATNTWYISGGGLT